MNKRIGNGLVPVLLLLSHNAWASTIKFNDLSDTLSVTLEDVVNGSFLCDGEICTVTLRNFLANPVAMNYKAQFFLTEPKGADEPEATVSDVIVFEAFADPNLGKPKDLGIVLISDPIGQTILNAGSYGKADEMGDFQQIPLPGDLPALAAGNALRVEVASDVPEPGPFVPLIVCALALFGVSRWRQTHC